MLVGVLRAFLAPGCHFEPELHRDLLPGRGLSYRGGRWRAKRRLSVEPTAVPVIRARVRLFLVEKAVPDATPSR